MYLVEEIPLHSSCRQKMDEGQIDVEGIRRTQQFVGVRFKSAPVLAWEDTTRELGVAIRQER